MLQASFRLVLALFAVSAASGAAVTYDFSGTLAIFGYVETFRYTSLAFISADTFVPASLLDSCSTGQSLPCFGVNFLPSGPDTLQHYPELTFQIANPDNSVATAFYYFPLGSSFATYGTLATFFGNSGTLTVSPVPEPSYGFGVVFGTLLFLVAQGEAFGSYQQRIRLLRPEPESVWSKNSIRLNPITVAG